MPHNKSFEVPVGEWVEVPKDMVVAPGTYVDEEGYLRFASNQSYAVWHRVTTQGDCPRWGQKNAYGVLEPMRKEEISVIDGTPYCIYCYGEQPLNGK